MCKFSLIIPVYNSEHFLTNLLESILKQTYSDFEIILVNDGSTDGSINVINRYIKKDKRIKCINIENSGPGVARKTGFQNASGELLYFIDSDDHLPNENVLEEINSIYCESTFDLLIFNYIQKINGNENKANGFSKNDDIDVGLHDTRIFNQSALRGALWCKIFKREKMAISDFCDANNYEDYYTTYKYLNKCKNYYYTDKILYYSDRDNENSISKKYSTKKIYMTIEILKKTYEETDYKSVFSKIIFNYYIFSRRLLDKNNFSKLEKNKCLKKLNTLKSYFQLVDIVKSKFPLKHYFKYIYYQVKDLSAYWRL